MAGLWVTDGTTADHYLDGHYPPFLSLLDIHDMLLGGGRGKEGHSLLVALGLPGLGVHVMHSKRSHEISVAPFSTISPTKTLPKPATI